MHPDTEQLAAYLDGGLAPDTRAELRAHILTCAACAARLDRLRADAGLLARTLAAHPAPDVRAAVSARLRRPAPLAWLGRGMGVVGALAALLLFALLIGAGAGATAGRAPDRLFVTDRNGGGVIALDARDGVVLGQARLGDSPSSVVYDAVRDRLYVLLKQAVVAVDPRSLQVAARWDAPHPFDSATGMALDARGGLLYVAQPGNVAALALDRGELSVARIFPLGQAPIALALAPDGRALFALDAAQARLWTIDTASGNATAQTLAPSSGVRSGYLAVSRDGGHIFVLLTRAGRDDQVALWRIDRSGASEPPAILSDQPPPWDMQLLDSGQLAIPRGDGQKGGVELLAPDTLALAARIDPQYDQHHAVAGPGGALFGLNFTRNTVTRFDAATGAVIWRTPERGSFQPWDGAYVPGGWRWPF
jgi:DNA-binding beta-propeller fold protein YncE